MVPTGKHRTHLKKTKHNKNSRLRILLCVALLFCFQSSIFNSAHAQNITYDTDTTCGCDIVYVDGIQTTREGDLYGFRRSDGKVLFPNIFRYVDQFSGGYCRVWIEDSSVSVEPGQDRPLLAGLIDSSGRQVLPCRYAEVRHPSNNRILVYDGENIGFSDLQGNIVIPIQYRDATTFFQGRAAVALVIDSAYLLYTFIDTLGRQLFPPSFQNARSFIDGFAPVRRYDRWGIIDTLGNEILPTVYEELSMPDHGFVFAGDNEGLALFNLNSKNPGHPVTQPLFRPITLLADGRIGVSRNGKLGYLDTFGNEVIPCQYDEIGPFIDNRAFVRLGDLCGIIDTLGHPILPLQYTNRTPKGRKYVYFDGLALVEQNGRLGYVDRDGNLAIPFYFEEAYQFSEGLAAVRKDGAWGYIDTNGDIFLPFIFDIAPSFRYGRAEVYFSGRPITIDRQGRCVRNCNGIISFR